MFLSKSLGAKSQDVLFLTKKTSKTTTTTTTHDSTVSHVRNVLTFTNVCNVLVGSSGVPREFALATLVAILELALAGSVYSGPCF